MTDRSLLIITLFALLACLILSVALNSWPAYGPIIGVVWWIVKRLKSAEKEKTS